jgi:hypothetical protein
MNRGWGIAVVLSCLVPAVYSMWGFVFLCFVIFGVVVAVLDCRSKVVNVVCVLLSLYGFMNTYVCVEEMFLRG